MEVLIIQEYLDRVITHIDTYVLSNEEQKIVQRDIKHFILQKLLLKKFRRQKVHPATLEEIKNKIALSVRDSKPIHFTIPFGGYKHFWNSSYPEPDWAEIFALRFLIDWVSPILAVYKPGVIIDFISEDMILPRMNNYPPEALETYTRIFQKLLETYQKYTPENLSFTFFRIGDRYDKEKIIQDVEALLPERWKNWEKYLPEQKEVELKRSKRSVFWEGDKDWTGFSEDEKQKRTIESRLIELAYYDVEVKPEYLGNYYTGDNHIGICFSFGKSPDNDVSHWLTLGTTSASMVDYWIGKGILEQKDNRFINLIVSRLQYEKIKNKLQVVKLHNSYLPFKNYQEIEVVQSNDWQQIMTD